MTTDQLPPVAPEADLRERAITRLKKRSDFHGHLLMYVLVNSVLIGIWAVSSPHAFFWPVFPLMGWGIGVIAHAWDTYRPEDLSEDRIQREMLHLQGRR